MARRFITLVLAAATALSLASTQARAASNEDIAKIAGGVALLLILGTAIDAAQADDDDEKKKDKKKKQKQKQADQTAWYDNHAPFRPGVHKGYPGKVKNGAHHDKRYHHDAWRTLPPQCRVRLPVAEDRKKGFYPSRCLKRSYPAFARLPAACNIKFKHDGRRIAGFWERCLDKRGYDTPRH